MRIHEDYLADDTDGYEAKAREAREKGQEFKAFKPRFKDAQSLSTGYFRNKRDLEDMIRGSQAPIAGQKRVRAKMVKEEGGEEGEKGDGSEGASEGASADVDAGDEEKKSEGNAGETQDQVEGEKMQED